MLETDTAPAERFDIEGVPDFRLARLVIVMSECKRAGANIDTIDRIAYLDFFSANPFAILGNDNRTDKDALQLSLAGFSRGQLSYRSVGHRYVTRRKSLQNDLGLLLALGLLSVETTGYELTDRGESLATKLQSAYGDAIRAASKIVARRIGRLSRKRLNELAERALGKTWLVLDLLDDVRDVEVLNIGDARG